MKNIAKSLAKFHEIMGNVAKDAKNPFFKSKYAPLESILPAIKQPLKEAGLVFAQYPSSINNLPALTTVIYDVESGDFLESATPLILAKQDPQGVGSAITYMRRYALVSILGLNCDEDDDGNASSPKQAVVKPTAPPVAPPKPTAKASALKAIEKANTAEELTDLNDKIIKSKVLFPEEIKELVSIIMTKLQTLDPIALS